MLNLRKNIDKTLQKKILMRPTTGQKDEKNEYFCNFKELAEIQLNAINTQKLAVFSPRERYALEKKERKGQIPLQAQGR